MSGAFEPGHRYYPPQHDERGAHAPNRRAARMLAEIWRADVDQVELRDIVLSIARGVDPVSRERITDARLRLDAIKLYLDRAWGTPQQSIQIEAKLAAQIVQVTASTSAAAYDDLPDHVLEALEKLGAAGALPAADDVEGG